MRCVAIIPARGGSKRIPKKNVRLFHGKPMLAYSIDAAKASGLFGEIYVSTDDDEAARIALDHGCHLHVRSNAYLLGDESGTQEVAQDCLLNSASPADFACVLYATAPMLDCSDLAFGLGILKCVQLFRYVYVPGWYYWGRVDAFLQVPTIEGSTSLCLTPDPARWVDINEEADWALAARMFAARREMA